jgi:hypothetical protein
MTLATEHSGYPVEGWRGVIGASSDRSGFVGWKQSQASLANGAPWTVTTLAGLKRDFQSPTAERNT